MSMPDELKLMAYAYGELGPEEAARVKKMVDNNPALSKRVAAFRAVDNLVTETFRPFSDAPIPEDVLDFSDAPVPQEILDMVQKKKESEHKGFSIALPAFLRDLPSFVMPSLPRQWVPALASGLACGFMGILVGVGGSMYTGNSYLEIDQAIDLVEVDPEFSSKGVGPALRGSDQDIMQDAEPVMNLLDRLAPAPIESAAILKEELNQLNALLQERTYALALDETVTEERQLSAGASRDNAAVGSKVAPEDLSARYDALALLFAQKGQYGEAETLFEESLRLKREMAQNDPWVNTQAYMNLAGVQKEQRLYEKAEANYKKALFNMEDAVGPDDPVLVSILHSLADVLLRQGRSVEAGTVSEKAIAIETRERVE